MMSPTAVMTAFAERSGSGVGSETGSRVDSGVGSGNGWIMVSGVGCNPASWPDSAMDSEDGFEPFSGVIPMVLPGVALISARVVVMNASTDGENSPNSPMMTMQTRILD